MKPLTHPYHYTDPAILQREKRFLFETTWQFVGVVQEVANHNDYIAAPVGNQSVVIQNFNGELKAFLNVCSHRFSQIQTTGCGNRPLRCRYHGWTFNETGLPIGIPHPEDFENLNPEDLCLKKFEVDICGNMVFVRVRNPHGQSLREFMGELYDHLEAIGHAAGDLVSKDIFAVDSNWKIPLENGIESYHANFVHHKTIGDDAITAVRSGRIAYHHTYLIPPHSWFSQLYSQKELAEWEKIEPFFADRPIRHNKHRFYHLFPNFTVTNMLGFHFVYLLYLPVAHATCKIVSYVFSCKVDNPNKQTVALIKYYAQKNLAGHYDVQEEDRAICPLIQQGYLSNAPFPGILSGQENRIETFQRAYLEYLNAAAPLVTV